MDTGVYLGGSIYHLDALIDTHRGVSRRKYLLPGCPNGHRGVSMREYLPPGCLNGHGGVSRREHLPLGWPYIFCTARSECVV